MPFRLLVWNIQFFTKKRICNTEVTAPPAAKLNDDQRAFSNLFYILWTIRQADPDVFVILEVRSTQGSTVGQLATGGGPDGLQYLLAQMRSQLSDQWCLVPPVRVNPRAIDDNLVSETATYTEAVGVFWRNDRVDFTGPMWWPKNSSKTGPSKTGPPIMPTGDQATLASTYPPPWDKVVPTGMVYAPCVITTKDGGKNPVILAKKTTTAGRRPVYTTFVERGGMQRTIRLFSIHTKPSEAADAMYQLDVMDSFFWKPGNNQVTLYAGDFNVNLLKNNRPTSQEALFQQFQDSPLSDAKRELIPLFQVSGAEPPSVFYTRSEAEPTLYLKQAVYDYGFVIYGTNARPNDLPPVRAVVADRVAGVTPGNTLPSFTTDMWVSLEMLNWTSSTSGLPIYPPSRVTDIMPNGAARQGGTTTITTKDIHGISPGDLVTVSGVAPVSFNGKFAVTSAPSLWTFTYQQKDNGNEAGGGGTADALPRLNIFRSRLNYGHMAPPSGEGTSDHLPVFMIV